MRGRKGGKTTSKKLRAQVGNQHQIMRTDRRRTLASYVEKQGRGGNTRDLVEGEGHANTRTLTKRIAHASTSR